MCLVLRIYLHQESGILEISNLSVYTELAHYLIKIKKDLYKHFSHPTEQELTQTLHVKTGAVMVDQNNCSHEAASVIPQIP